jgi:hypothetical protein
MAEKDEHGPSLELPTFGLRRRRKKEAAEPEQQSPPEPETTRIEPAEPATAKLEPVETPPAAGPAQAPPFQDEQPAAAAAPAPPPAPADGDRKATKEPREFTLPAVSGMVAAVVTGLVVGAATVGLIRASFRLCEVLRGAPTCGDPGFLLLAAIMVGVVLLGAFLLRAWKVPDPGSTSFLAVGLLAVIALLFLVDVLFDWWMIIAIPLVAMLTFALSHWVTATFIEPAKD